MRTLTELNCHMVYEKNNVMDCINGYLVKTDGKAGSVKAFLYHTKEECLEAATAWANNHARGLKNAGWGRSWQVRFQNKVDYDGFKIGNQFDRDVYARACGYRSGSTVAVINFESKQGYGVQIDFMSIGDQRISIDSTDSDAQEIALKYDSELASAEDKKEWLESLEESFNRCEITKESQLFAIKELESGCLLQWRDNSWYEARIEIFDGGKTILSSFESNLALGCDVYASIDEIKALGYEEAHALFVDGYLNDKGDM